MIESAESPVELPGSNPGLSTTALTIQPHRRGYNQLNQTVNYGPANTQKWCAQSEEGLVQKARIINDSSFYSFKLQPIGNRRIPGEEHDESVYDGMIYRKSFPRDRHYEMSSSDSSFNRNNCC